MARVRLTRHLKRFFPDLAEEEQVGGGTVAEVIDALDARHPGLAHYLRDDAGALRKHVNVFVNDEMVADRRGLGDAVPDDAEVLVVQALSGG